jgi:two-component system response regulator MprA
MTNRVLVVDDDPAIRDSLRLALELEGYEVMLAEDGASALSMLRGMQVDVVVLDLMMPGVDGITVCRVLRAENDRTPILMLTARTQTSDRVDGLDAGADDYLPKPFDLDELLARLRALLRRVQPPDTGSPGSPLQVGALSLDPHARRAWSGDHEFEFSKTEFDLLELLMRNAGIVLEHATIYDRIWGYDFGPDSKNLAVYISYLRRKLDAGGCDGLIRTTRGVGYSIQAP